MNFKRLTNFVQILILVSTLNLFAQTEKSLVYTAAKEHLTYLASDELEGRFPGTPGMDKARDYILNKFKPINGSYLQQLEVPIGYELGEKNEVYFNVIIPKPGVPIEMSRPMRKSWDLTSDWLPLSISDDGELEAPLAFCGFGISSKDLKYDDYEGIDVKDKIVIILTHSPNGEMKDDPFEPYKSYRYKATNARDHGAKGIIFVKINGDSASVFEPLEKDRFERNTGLLAIQVNRTKISEYFPRRSLYPTEMKIMETKKPNSFDIPNSKIYIKVQLKDKIAKTDNVFGMVEGTDATLKNEYIVVGAHYDHLGWGGPTSMYQSKTPKIHNGADDNASGTSAVIELARYAAENPTKRSLVFVAFTSEELGIIGSNAFVNQKIIAPENIAMMINLDMVGRFHDNSIYLMGTGSSPAFEPIFDELDAADSVLTLNKSDSPLGASDQTAFYLKNVPSVFFFTGVHLDYHKPSDDVDKINFDGMETIINFLDAAVQKFGNLDNRPPFHKVSEKSPAHGENRSGSKVKFGIVPNFDREPLGMKISGASPGSPAEKAGLQGDDIITKLNDTGIMNLHDFTFFLRESKPGDKIKVTFLRKGKEMTTDVILTGSE